MSDDVTPETPEQPTKVLRPGGRYIKGNPGGPGRQSKLNSDIAEKICALIRAGNYIETAAAYVGIHKETIYDWFRKGADRPRSKYRRFADAVGRAVAESEMRDLAKIGTAADTGAWQAAAWRLERRFPDRWCRKDRVTQEVSGPGGKPIQTESKTETTGPLDPKAVAEAYREVVRREIEAETRNIRVDTGSAAEPAKEGGNEAADQGGVAG